LVTRKAGDYSLSILGSGGVISLVSKSRFDYMIAVGNWAVVKLIYHHFYNRFDFLLTGINLYSAPDEVGTVGGYFVDIENSITGLGKSIFDRSILVVLGLKIEQREE